MVKKSITDKPIILIIDDEPAILKELKSSLEEESYYVDTLEDPTRALDIIGQLVPDLVLLDIFMPKMGGLELLTKIRKEYPHQKIMVISGFGTISMALDALRLGAIDFIEKPLNLDEILLKLDTLKSKNIPDIIGETAVNQCYEDFGIVGQSYLFRELMQSVDQVALLNLPLLIYGEHGVGKTLIARYMHHKKYQNDTNFFLYDCQQEETFDSLKERLFSDSAGTVYLKHLHCLSSVGQQNIVNIMRSGTHNFRFIASSCESLFAGTVNHTFNASLFHYFNVIPLEIPSINKRRYDIPLLIHYFLHQQNEWQKKTVTFNVASIRMLRNISWIGNVSQLREFIKIMVTFVPISMDIVTPEFLQRYMPEINVLCVEEQIFTKFPSLKVAILMFEKQFLLHALKKNRYDLQQASDYLSLNISQLRDRMLELRIMCK